MEAFTERNPKCLQWIALEEFNDNDLFRIVIFFVFHSPCDGLSVLGKTLQEYGWSNPLGKPFYLNKQLKKVVNNTNLLTAIRNYSDMNESLEKTQLLNDFMSEFSLE